MNKRKKILVFEPSGNITGQSNQKSDRLNSLLNSLQKFSEKGIKILSHDDIEYKEHEEEIFKEIDIHENLIIAHFTDLDRGDFEKLKDLENAIGIYYTGYWSNGKYRDNSSAQDLHNNSNKFVAGADDVEANITEFVEAILNNQPNPYYYLIGFDPLLEAKLLVWKHLNNQYHKAPDNFEAAKEKINEKIAPYIKNSEQELTPWQSFTEGNFNEEGLSVLYERLFDW